jgi:5-formyltetrahydrofolate cyclo-ligase
MNKKELRIKHKALRQLLTDDEIEEKSLAIANRLLQLDIWNKNYYHLFLSIEHQKEINTEYTLQILAGKDKEIVVPKCDFENQQLHHYLLTDNTRLKVNQYNIPEPVDGLEVPVNKIDVVFVPLLTFDNTGHRIGYGKGFYDKFLSKCREDVIKVGLSFFEGETIISDVYENDIKIDYCVTPNETYTF